MLIVSATLLVMVAVTVSTVIVHVMNEWHDHNRKTILYGTSIREEKGK